MIHDRKTEDGRVDREVAKTAALDQRMAESLEGRVRKKKYCTAARLRLALHGHGARPRSHYRLLAAFA